MILSARLKDIEASCFYFIFTKGERKMTTKNQTSNQLMEIASRIRELRDIMGWTPEQMAEKTEVDLEIYES